MSMIRDVMDLTGSSIHFTAGAAVSAELLDLAPVGVYTVDAAARITSYNRRAAELWGREPELGFSDQLYCGAHKLYRVDGTYLPHDQTPMAHALATGEPTKDQEVIIERPDGSRIVALVNIAPIKDAQGALRGAINCFLDITERKRMEEALSQSEAFKEHLLSILPAGVYSCDKDGRITSFNQQAVELWGRAPKLNDLIDRFCGSFKIYDLNGVPIPHSECPMGLTLRDGIERRNHEIVIERPDGSRAVALVHPSPIRDEQGALIGAVNCLLDITERKQADQRKDEFLATLAHELRNPLAAIAGAVALLERETANSQEARIITGVLDRQVNHLTRIIDDLLDVSRITRGLVELRKERIQLATVVEHALDAIRPAIAERQQRLEVILPGEPIWVEADLTRMAQVMSNLLSNAAKYTHPGGSICVTVSKADGVAVMEVRDTGRGIAEDFLPHVFDVFTRAEVSRRNNPGGLGLGLTLVKRLVAMHGGGVEARSEGLGKGSTFIVRLPVSAQRETLGESATVEGKSSMAGPMTRVLVVDDNADIAMTLSLLLRRMGYEVTQAEDGESALRQVQEFQPDVVLLDIGLPGMDGYEVARALRADSNSPQRKLIALTGFGQEQDRERSRQAGFDDHLVKPVQLDALRRAIGGGQD